MTSQLLMKSSPRDAPIVLHARWLLLPYYLSAGGAIEGGSYDITPVFGTLASRADTGRLQSRQQIINLDGERMLAFSFPEIIGLF
jgi:hypothetical protein